jgi:hypothetical protein
MREFLLVNISNVSKTLVATNKTPQKTLHTTEFYAGVELAPFMSHQQ